MRVAEGYICHDCGVIEGQIHKRGCDMERCAACGGQLISCSCMQSSRRGTKRVPYILYPIVCAGCGVLWPEMFMVPDKEWKRYVQVLERDKVLCRGCYNRIKKLIDDNHR